MKQLLFMIGMLLVGTVGAIFYSPFLGVLVYYTFAVLRPQFLWQWALGEYGEIGWSMPVAVATILSALAHGTGLVSWKSDQEEKPPALGLSGAHCAVLFFGAWVVLSYMFADTATEVAQVQFMVLLKILVMFAVSAHLLRTTRQLWLLLLMTAFTLAFIGYELNFEYLKQRKIFVLNNGYGGLDNNGAATMLAMGVPLCLFAWEGSRRWWRWLFAAAIPVLIHAVLLTFSRGGMLALALSAPLFYLRSNHKKMIGLAYLGVALILPVMAGQEVRDRFFSIERYEEDESARSRFRSWQAGWEMAIDHPLFGVGFRNSGLYMERYGSEEGRTIHSQYIQIAADSGLLGIGLYLFALGTVWRGLLQARRRILERHDPDQAEMLAIANGVECSMAVFCIAALFLSLDVFELAYLLLLIGAQLPVLVNDRLRQEAVSAMMEANATEDQHAEPARLL